jgi:hypothetical protein
LPASSSLGARVGGTRAVEEFIELCAVIALGMGLLDGADEAVRSVAS